MINQIRIASTFVRATATVLLVAFSMLILTPSVVAARAEYGRFLQVAQQQPSDEARFVELVQKIQLGLISWKEKLTQGLDGPEEEAELRLDRASLDVLDETIGLRFQEQRQQILDQGLAEVILKRHDESVAAYQQGLNQLRQHLDAVLQAPDMKALQDALSLAVDWLQSKKHKRSQQPFDPNNLPNKSREADPENKPRHYKEEFFRSGLFNSPMPKLAGLGDFTFDNLAGANDPAYLAETDEVNLNQLIRDKAAELNHDPIKIYHWVRNNVEWLPTWGAVQDAELTLSAKRGNAFDIASLTVALLRASEIPARYVHGTIDVSLDVFRNWAGGFDTAEAAANYASSGGIPVTLMTTNGPEGQTQTIRMEHVWVESAIDYVPSRGARNFDADEWVELDPSYKQYESLGRLDSAAISGINPEQLAQSLIDSGQINETEGWATGFDPVIVEQAQSQAQQALEQYISNNLTDPTVSDVIGGIKTIIKEYPILPASLPNIVVVAGARYDKVPSQLQQKISFSFEKDILGNPLNPATFAWSKLNNEKVTLGFTPATAADEQALDALVPDSVTDLSQLPESIPSNLIRMVPELRVNGELVKSGSSIKPGEEMNFTTDISFVGTGRGEPPRTYKVIAGSFLSVNVIAGSVSPAKLETLQVRMEQTKAILASGDQALIGSLTREEMLGDLFYAGTLSYYAQLLALSRIAGMAYGAHQYLAAGTGTIGHEPQVSYFFGFPQSIQAGGVVFDIPLITASAVNDGDLEKRKRYQFQTGMLASTLEHVTPEQMFTSLDPNDPAPDAISAVKAIQKASAAGQRIYRINQQNRTVALPSIHHDSSTMSEITSALNAGKEVITHTDAVSVPGWSGAGYIILDPDTGTGAFKIAGGTNGGWLFKAINKGLFWLGAALSFLEKHKGVSAAFDALIAGVTTLVSTIMNMVEMLQNCKSVPFAVAITAILLIATIIMEALLIATGVGMIAAFAIGLIVGQIENKIIDQAKSSPLCTRG